ncbi:rhomboid family intramembrane serine protease [Segetibacter sp. 3557_3]|uniref:rhomboid family intramembrane serine protease n=1 Tax=Segetibacter sp. 3557_3 TaxID=2547429 RepID=UPI001058DE83|nr:rhomboid family intramembrane serine protease [Segetibacter sp. 3557_3]TDH29280.1 rhomboid family intramembrane serine protease [Segetibacter sp. 3557_3]
MFSITVIIIAITCIFSFLAFSNERLTATMIFDPPAVSEHNQWYRFWSCALIHGDFFHLLFNMFTLYSFGEFVERGFNIVFGSLGPIVYISLYVISQFLCLLPTYVEHKHNHYYRSLGASGAVSAVVFAGIMLMPTAGMGILFIPFMIPGFIFGPLFLIISAYIAKRGHGNINHSAHIFGAVAGVGIYIVASFALTTRNPLTHFYLEVMNYFN